MAMMPPREVPTTSDLVQVARRQEIENVEELDEGRVVSPSGDRIANVRARDSRNNRRCADFSGCLEKYAASAWKSLPFRVSPGRQISGRSVGRGPGSDGHKA